MAKNNFKAFALDPNANVMSQADWEALPALLSGFTSGKASSAQVNKALRQATFIASAVAQFVSDTLTQDVNDDGNSAAFIAMLKQAVINGSVPAGIPMPWPTATPPTGWLKCNGANFNTSTYPLLAKAFPSGKLPDLRGEFIRGWDDGRGVDSGRTLLSSQSHAFTDHLHALSLWTGSGLGKNDSVAQKYSPQASKGDGGSMDESTNNGGALGFANSTNYVASSFKTYASNETRPRNVAFNYIVRAA